MKSQTNEPPLMCPLRPCERLESGSSGRADRPASTMGGLRCFIDALAQLARRINSIVSGPLGSLARRRPIGGARSPATLTTLRRPISGAGR